MTWEEALEEIKHNDNGTSVQDEIYHAVATQIEANRIAIEDLQLKHEALFKATRIIAGGRLETPKKLGPTAYPDYQ